MQQQLKGKEVGRGPLQTLGKDVSIKGSQNISVPSKAILTSANLSKNKQTERPSLLQTTRRVQWQDLDCSRKQIEPTGMVSENSQTFEPSTHSLDSPVPYAGLAYTLPLPTIWCFTTSSSDSAVPVSIDPMTSVLLAQQLPPLPKFSGEVNDGELGLSTYEDWLEHFELMATSLRWSS